MVKLDWTQDCKRVLLRLQDNYFNFRFLDASNTATRRRNRKQLCGHSFNDVELPDALGDHEKFHLVQQCKEMWCISDLTWFRSYGAGTPPTRCHNQQKTWRVTILRWSAMGLVTVWTTLVSKPNGTTQIGTNHSGLHVSWRQDHACYHLTVTC
jgi:hypothetical protein